MQLEPNLDCPENSQSLKSHAPHKANLIFWPEWMKKSFKNIFRPALLWTKFWNKIEFEILSPEGYDF